MTTNPIAIPEALLIPASKRGRPPKAHDNTAVRAFVRCFWNATDMVVSAASAPS